MRASLEQASCQCSSHYKCYCFHDFIILWFKDSTRITIILYFFRRESLGVPIIELDDDLVANRVNDLALAFRCDDPLSFLK